MSWKKIVDELYSYHRRRDVSAQAQFVCWWRINTLSLVEVSYFICYTSVKIVFCNLLVICGFRLVLIYIVVVHVFCRCKCEFSSIPLKKSTFNNWKKREKEKKKDKKCHYSNDTVILFWYMNSIVGFSTHFYEAKKLFFLFSSKHVVLYYP